MIFGFWRIVQRVIYILYRVKVNRVFSARQHIAYTIMLSALYAIARPSVYLSHGCIVEKRLKLGL